MAEEYWIATVISPSGQVITQKSYDSEPDSNAEEHEVDGYYRKKRIWISAGADCTIIIEEK